jgi:hypothetical protein
MPTSVTRDQYNPSLTIADALGIGFVIGSFVTTIIIATVLFVMKKKICRKNIVAHSKTDEVGQRELENGAGKVVREEDWHSLQDLQL